MSYPQTAGYQKHSSTSKEAADRLTSMKTMEDDIISILKNYPYGLIADELVDYLKPDYPTTHQGTVAARLRGLELKGKAVKTDATRKTRNDRPAHIWVHPDNTSKSGFAPRRKKATKETAYREALEKAERFMSTNGYGKDMKPLYEIIKGALT